MARESSKETVETCRLTILPENKTITCLQGSNLYQALVKADIGIKSLCGGEGTCLRCQVIVREGNFSETGESRLPAARREKGYVLACQVKVEGDLVIEIPESSRLTGNVMRLTRERGQSGEPGGETRTLPGGQIECRPLFQRYALKLEAPSLLNNTSDLDRLFQGLRRQTGRESFTVNPGLLRELAVKMRRNNWDVTASCTELPALLEVMEIEKTGGGEVYGLAVDVGTTSVVVQLVELEKGELSAVKGAYNRQGQFGGDVISRINYICQHRDGLTLLQGAVINTVNELIKELHSEVEFRDEEIRELVFAGNTTMTHILIGLNPDHIRRAPYTPTISSPPPLTAAELGLSAHPRARVFCFPAVGSFVGGDITAGVLATGINRQERLTLFVDIGTNGEIVLGNQEFLIACSASAGPAFEGGGITHGMRAVPGAIENIILKPEADRVIYQTIGGRRPVGLCGTGLINTLAQLEKTGIINRSGEFDRGLGGPRLRENGEGLEYVLVYAGETEIGEDIVITGGDIKNLMRSKAAVFAAIQVLLGYLDLDKELIERVLIAGGFGNYLDLEATINIGLLPDLPRNRFQFVGNSSLLGAIRGLLNRSEYEEGLRLGRKMTYLELSSEEYAASFMEEFVAATFIPHTNLELFPSLI